MSDYSGLSSSVRRVVTGHSADGKALVWKDEQTPCVSIFASDGAKSSSARFAHLWTTDKSPWDNTDERDLALGEDGKKLSNTEGSVLRIVDCPPHSDSPFHRTQSLDYGIIHSGSIVLTLDDGTEVPMNKGDVCVQRGTIHGWRNDSDEWCRIYFILLASEPIVVDGKKLGDHGYARTD